MLTELWRRFPDRYALIETHPGGGQYDCLSLADCRNGLHTVLDINRGGSVHLHQGRSPQSWTGWTDRMLEDASGFLDELEQAMGFTHPTPLPSSTSATLTFRFVPEFLTHAIGRLERWECRNGFCDTSGFGGGKRETYFSCFPQVEIEVPAIEFAKGRIDSAYLHWFLLRNGEPQACLDTNGRLYKTDGATHDLMELYSKCKRIWPVIAEVALDILP
jgi:hypothetical protein